VLQMDKTNKTASSQAENIYRMRSMWSQLSELLLARVEFPDNTPQNRIDTYQAIARIYEDNGEEGTAGFTEDAIDPVCCTDARVLFIRSTSYLVAPAIPAHFRYNVGIRSLFKAPTLTFSVVGSGTSVTRSYPPSSFEQRSAEELLGAPLPPNALIAIQVDAGTAIVYGATVDNVTNDASIQFASVAFTSPN